MAQVQRKQIKRNIRESMVAVEQDDSLLQFEGGADEILESRDTCILTTSKIVTDLAILVIMLNVIGAPIGTFVAAGADKRGFNMKLFVMGFIYLVLFIINQIMITQLETKW